MLGLLAALVSAWSAAAGFAAEPLKLYNVVCFVKFADEADKEWEHDRDYYEQMFNNSDPGANSVRNYFSDMSYGRLEWESFLMPFEYVDSHSVGYFCPKDSNNPEGYADLDLMLDTRIKSLVRDMCNFFSEKLATFDVNGDGVVNEEDKFPMDGNGDGEIDNLVIIICGNSDINSSRMLWPANNRGASAYINGLKVGNYLKVFDGANGYKSTLYEYIPLKLNTGVLCHEMMHTLNAYDLYTSSKTNTLEPVNVWDLMSDNQTVPQGLTAYTRMTYGTDFGNWLPKSDVPVLTEAGEYTLPPLSTQGDAPVAFKIVPSKTRDEYFMVEYRDKSDMWDSSLPNSGLLVYRVKPGTQGNLGSNMELYVFRPNGSTTSGGIVNSAPLGPDTRRTSFGHADDNDYPFFSDGTRAYFCLTNVKKTAEGMSFKFFPNITASAVTELEAEDENTPQIIYNLQGVRIDRITSPGIYIVNGRKVRITNY